ncbi:MAG: hypothetical protein AAGJ82_06965 [Bacteroidota bacterium]
MSSFWQRLFRLEKAVNESSPSQPAIHELIARSPVYQTDYTQWKTGFVRRRLTDWLGDQYAIYRRRPQDIDGGIAFLNTPSSKGFIIYFHQTNYSRTEATYLFDYFKERVQTENYRVQLSDLRTYNRRDWVETVEKHYLKPRLDFDPTKKQQQQFGNVTIELEIRNDQVHNLRLRATHYRDHLYEEARDFRELMQVLLSNSES